ncbi:hypothetical protein G6R40_01905 [Chryseobacterium sp. POL2]|uniref:hypothetical protein n=1 Tax=Chryseobacterium sp. POL2 TaxID=2713414 RepID=UPI0013E149D6|nr:hypothetical protein [Chryseobacterium sp. POL2]QIG88486.1 hypothetical protein G6R40_01905 [Chryseobacterium sp. POL2]
MKYRASVENFFDENNFFLFRIKELGKWRFFKYKSTFQIVDINDKILLEYQFTRGLFNTSRKNFIINEQNLSENIEFLEKQNSIELSVRNNIISIETKSKLMGFYEGKIQINGNNFGVVKQTGKFLNPINYNFEFSSKSPFEIYALILFAIISTELNIGA